MQHSASRRASLGVRGLALFGLALATGCTSPDLWTGSRCPEGDSECAAPPESTQPLGAQDAATTTPDADCSRCDADAGDANTPPNYCAPGTYQMTSDSWYRSAATGLCGVIGPFANSTAIGAGTITLYAPRGDGGVGNACLRTTPDPNYDIGWRGHVTGSIDCATGLWKGVVRASYHVVSYCTLGIIDTPYYAKGTLYGVFQAAGTGMDGHLEVAEPPALVGAQPGGEAMINAVRDADAGVTYEDEDDCVDAATFPEDAFASPG